MLKAMPLADDHVLLLGHPPATEFFQLVRTQVPDGERLDAAVLVAEWKNANTHVRALQEREAGLANAPVTDLPAEMEQAARLGLASPAARYSQRISKRRWGMVELDRLVVIQRRINLAWVAELEAAIGPSPVAEMLIRVATGEMMPQPVVTAVRNGDASYLLTCGSGELRFFGTRTIDPLAIDEQTMGGQVASVIGLFVGFGVNLMCALHYRGRLVLTNGTHRAYAMRNLGIRNAPCLILEAGHEDDLELLGMRELRPQIERYARSARPPLLKDYFDPLLRKVVPIVRVRHALELKVTTTSLLIPP
ncbi:MAG: hypothetical protein ACREO8_08485 [Luteimonas sp.]